MIPGELKARFNLRFATVQTVDELKTVVEEILRRHRVNYSLEWYVSGYPFLTAPGSCPRPRPAPYAKTIVDRRRIYRPAAARPMAASSLQWEPR